jgi:putative ABC transport system permease protein
VASLVLSRAAARGRELAVRVALGASRSRMIRQTLTESVLLALLGGALAIVVATWGLRGLLAFVPDDLPRAADVHIDRWAMLFTFGVALFTGVIFGLIPAWHTARTDPQAMLRNSSGRTTATAGQSRVRDALVVTEVALSLVLLVGAGLMIRTFANLMRTDPGFDPQHQLSAEIWLTGSRYDSPTTIAGFYRDLTARLQAIPGVASSAVVEAGMPLERGGNMGVSIDGQPIHSAVDYRTITPDYFRTLGIATHAGRTFTTADDAGAAPVIVISDAFAKRYFPDGSPIGRSVKVGGSSDVPRTVIGVVGDVKSFIGYPAQATVFLPSAQTPYAFTRIFNGW